VSEWVGDQPTDRPTISLTHYKADVRRSIKLANFWGVV